MTVSPQYHTTLSVQHSNIKNIHSNELTERAVLHCVLYVAKGTKHVHLHANCSKFIAKNHVYCTLLRILHNEELIFLDFVVQFMSLVVV